MNEELRIKNLSLPKGKIDVVLDTDTYNEIDDQFALSYMLLSKEKLNCKAIYAAPFHNTRSSGPKDGMEKSYDEIIRLLEFLGEDVPVFKGSESYLPNEKEAVISPAAKDLAERVNEYSPENPLYIVAIGAITNVASAMLLNPKMAENAVVVWLGGHADHYHNTKEFNMFQDIAAARVVMGSGVPFVQLPCMGVVSEFRISKPELEYWLKGKNPLADYLADTAIKEADSYAFGKPWTRVIWDVTAVGWLVNDCGYLMDSRLVPTKLPTYDFYYSEMPNSHLMCYVYSINRDELMKDLFDKIINFKK